jgi:hypothetical protein
MNRVLRKPVGSIAKSFGKSYRNIPNNKFTFRTIVLSSINVEHSLSTRNVIKQHIHSIHSQSSRSSIFDRDLSILEKWRESRDKWNDAINFILEEPDLKAKVIANRIDLASWYAFVNLYRRTMIINPQQYFPFQPQGRGETDNQTTPTEPAKHTNNPSNPGLQQLITHVNNICKFANRLQSGLGADQQTKLKEGADFIFNLLLESALKELKDVIRTNQLLSVATDLSYPHEWFPYARIMKRKVFFHGGPTNSGKVISTRTGLVLD